ncbi:hypothetical protein TcWFU_005916 [Taenia crassiceps]|uniref:Uncharacterized protein n=1 Tax=Taenia crassiceps TaxID=6207 RepID=A0ABR4Q325_9CEST
MGEVGPVSEDLSVVFRKWARTNLTNSMKKLGTLRSMGKSVAEDVEGIIKCIRQTKLVDPFSTWSERNKEWWDAATAGNMHNMILLLNDDPSILHWKNPLDGTALHYVAKSGNLRCLDLLAKHHGANVDTQCKTTQSETQNTRLTNLYYGSTPLHIAVMFSQRLFARSLVQVYHARTDIMDYTGRFPRDLISTPEMKEDLEELLTSGRLAVIRKQFGIPRKPQKFPSIRANPTFTQPTTIDVYTRLLLSTLSHDQEYVNTLVRRLRRASFVYPFDLLDDKAYENGPSRHGRRGNSQKRGSVFTVGVGDGERRFTVFKVPHLPHPPRNLSAGALMTGGLWKRNTLEVGEKGKRWRREQKAAQKMMRKNSVSTMSVFGGGEKNGGTSSFERHSFVSIEHLTARMDAVKTMKGGGAVEEDGRISRHPSNVSDCVTKSSSDDYAVFDSVSSSPSLGCASGEGVRRTSSLSSLVACTEDLFSQYFPSSPSSPQ